MPEPVQLTKDNIVDKIIECAQILDEQELPTGGRWVWLPDFILDDPDWTPPPNSILHDNGALEFLDA